MMRISALGVPSAALGTGSSTPRPRAVSRGKSVRRFAQDDGFVGVEKHASVLDFVNMCNLRLPSIVRKGMALDDPAPFANHDPLIGVYARDSLHVAHGAVRPADRQIGFGGVAHAEVHAKVSLGDVVSAAANFVDLIASANLKRQSRTDGVPAGSGNGADQQRVAPGT